MLTAQGCASRRERLWNALPAPCDVLVIADPLHLTYFASYVQSPFTFRHNEAGALLLLTPGRAVLVADNLLQPHADEAHVDQAITPTWYDGVRSAGGRRAMLLRSALDALQNLPGRRLGIEPAAVPAGLVEALRAARPDLELVDLSPTIRRLRRAKDPDELALLRRSIAATEAGHAAALELIRPGPSEFEAYLAIQRVALEAVGDRAIVYGDFEAAPRAEAEEAPPSQRVLRDGDLFILDFSVIIHNYRGDFANTIAVGGKPTPRQRELFEGCVAALEAGEAALRPGIPARDVDAAVRRAFAERGLDPHFPSHSGHGVGLGHPEPPFLVPESDDTLLPGDVVTLEPGQYGPDFGGMRYERNYLITADGYETLTRHKLALVP